MSAAWTLLIVLLAGGPYGSRPTIDHVQSYFATSDQCQAVLKGVLADLEPDAPGVRVLTAGCYLMGTQGEPHR